MMSAWDKNKKFNIILWLIAGVALILRLWNMWFGLPLLLDPDEPVFVNAAMYFGSTKTLNPHWFGHPGNILMYLLFVEFSGYYLIGHILGWFDSVEAFKHHYHMDPTAVYILGRAISVLAGTLGVIAIGRLGKRLKNERVGIVTALFLAVDPLSIRFSKLIRGDILGTLFIILAILYGLRFWDSRRQRDIILASVAIGVAIATKYPFAIVGIIVLLLVFFLWFESSKRVLSTSGLSEFPLKFVLVNCLVIVLSFFCVTPFFFFDFQKAWQDILAEARGHHVGAESLPLLQNYWWYIYAVLRQNSGLLMLLGAAIGLFTILRNLDKRKILVLAFPILFFLFIGAAPLKWSRWIIPVLPFLGLFAAMDLDYLLSRLSSLKMHKSMVAIRWAALMILTVAFTFYPLKTSIALNQELAVPDTRQLCTDWIKENIPEGKFAQDFYTFQPSPRYAYWVGEFQFEKYKIFQDITIASRTLETYRVSGYTHIIVSSWFYDRYFSAADRFPQEVEFYRSLFADVPLKTFEFVDNAIKGPRIAIYAINRDR